MIPASWPANLGPGNLRRRRAPQFHENGAHPAGFFRQHTGHTDIARPYRAALRQGHERQAVRGPAPAKPDINLDVGSATHAVQTAEVMRRFEPVIDMYKPSCVLVVGDVNSTLACTLVAVKKGIPVVHVEAGLRSYDRKMPEEINRILTDQIADRLYTTEHSARRPGPRRNRC